MKKVVTVGGGTGQSTVLLGLKNVPNIQISAIVTMADSGGTNGMLRRELGVHPPSDARQCLVALSDNESMKKIFSYRFQKGELRGHSLGSIILAVLEKKTGSITKAIEKASKILNAKGEVIPVTLDNAELVAKLKNGKIIRGEHEIDARKPESIQKVFYKNKVRLNSDAKNALLVADYIIICPGDLYTSLAPNFTVEGFKQALSKSRAKTILIPSFGKENKAKLEEYLGKKFDIILNGQKTQKIRNNKADLLKRSTLRHDPRSLARALSKII